MYDLSVLIPARNEQFLQQTIDDVLAHRRGKTEVIVVLDGAWPSGPGIKDHPDVTLIHHATSVGQRAATNEAARVSRAKFIMKLDAHCAMDEGFDVKLMADCEYNWTVVPRLYNLHVFDWKCKQCGNQTYQGPKPTNCTNEAPPCSSTEFEMLLVWQPRWSRVTDSMRFDSDLHFQYFREFNSSQKDVDKANRRSERNNDPYRCVFRPGGQGDITDTMSLLGACWFLHRERYWEIDGLDEAHGSWGQMGSEIACKSWLSGGRLVCNKKTWYSHLFRTQPGFQFPYPISHSQTAHARSYSQEFWRGNKWPKAKHPLSWLLEKFWPVPGWTEEELRQQKVTEGKEYRNNAIVMPLLSVPEDNLPRPRFVSSAAKSGLTAGVVYYTDNRLESGLSETVQKQIQRSINGHQLVSVSLKPVAFGDNIVLGLERGYLTMFNQILAGLSLLDTDYAFLCEHDVLYTPEHFHFVPPKKDVYYYNNNVWVVSARTGHALFHFHNSVSQLCANRRLLVDHYRERIARVEREGFRYRNGFEPGTRRVSHNGYDDFHFETWFASRPNIDIRDTGTNLTKTLWKREQFRNEKFTAGWTEASGVPGWGVTEGRFPEFLADVKEGRISS